MASRSSRMKPNWTTVSAVWGPISRGSIARRAVSGVVGSGAAVGRLSRTTCGIVSSMSVALQASEDVASGTRTSFVVVIGSWHCFWHCFAPAAAACMCSAAGQCLALLLTSRLNQPQRFSMFEQQCKGPLADVCGPMGWFLA